ncbi:NAD(P)-dependent dehydrogenase, short-chain alcohol dehydrogenase family [Collimonas sp. OK607]|uniref:SDR family oxidoreductase n=1 Tax=Collimonas sp. OK607 TaxID=1798194 RepID=UPI0008E28D7F|nr:SDR family oxidoreductase [Collimonas sp. OK607]SFB14459.1 NAD(P)-dependent dehydrogenase, short-chain alcohol dehydrogenase family [Collimonas sp. OK607]
MKQVIVITGASSGFGALAARALARAGHTVYASMRETQGRNAPQVTEVARYAAEHGVDLRTVELDVAANDSVDAGVARIIADCGRLDVVIHNAGHMSFGPAEAFTPEQFAQLYNINVLSTQRVNRAALPQLRKQGKGLVMWISSSSARGGTPPYLSPYFAAKAAMDSLAVSYAGELARWGIETSIIVPGAFTKGTNHFAHSGAPADQARAAEYDDGPYAGVPQQALQGLAALEPADADVATVADAIVEVIGMPFGSRPFRTHIDPSQDGCEIVNGVADRVRSEMFRRIGLDDLLHPKINVGVNAQANA